MELQVDNRIILALSKVTGRSEGGLDNVFVFGEKSKSPVYFASDGYVALRIIPTQENFNFEGDFVLAIPPVFKKLIKYNKKEKDDISNSTIFTEENGNTKATFFNNDLPYNLTYTKPAIIPFEKMPTVFSNEAKEQTNITFNAEIVNNVRKALVCLGFDSMNTFIIDDRKLHGCRSNDNFIVDFVIMRGRVDNEK